jgi:hypothetical protein
MPIEFFQSPNGLSARQSFDSPTVYLDHWAIRLFSDDRALQDRFVAAMVNKRGTLLLSHLSLMEFAPAADRSHCEDAEAFIQRLLPGIYLTDFRIDETLSREQAEPNNVRRFWPTADLPQLKLFAERAQQLGRLTMGGFICLAHTHRDALGQLMDEYITKVQGGLEQARADPAYVEKARSVPISDRRPRTHIIGGELMRTFNLDANAPITRNDVVDMVHALAPLNCCDYVLLDGPWAERVAKMNQRIAKTSMAMPIAKCFSRRDNGLGAFLDDLEAFDGSQASPAVP